MTPKHFAKTAGYTLLSAVFPTPKPRKNDFDIEAHIEQVQASFRYAVKDHLKPTV